MTISMENVPPQQRPGPFIGEFLQGPSTTRMEAAAWADRSLRPSSATHLTNMPPVCAESAELLNCCPQTHMGGTGEGAKRERAVSHTGTEMPLTSICPRRALPGCPAVNSPPPRERPCPRTGPRSESLSRDLRLEQTCDHLCGGGQ